MIEGMSFFSLFYYVYWAIALWLAFELFDWVARLRRYRNHPRSEALGRATPGLQLAPRISPFIKRGSTLYVVGRSSKYASSLRWGIFWRLALRLWLRRGCKIHYILTEELAKGLDGGTYKKLAAEFPEQFILHFAPIGDGDFDEETERLMKKLSSTHPTILDIGDGRTVMWLERSHPEGQSATDIEFLVPEHTAEDRRVQTYLSEIGHLVKALSAIDIGPKKFSHNAST